MINESISFKPRFRLKDVSENVMQQEVLNLNYKKPGKV